MPASARNAQKIVDAQVLQAWKRAFEGHHERGKRDAADTWDSPLGVLQEYCCQTSTVETSRFQIMGLGTKGGSIQVVMKAFHYYFLNHWSTSEGDLRTTETKAIMAALRCEELAELVGEPEAPSPHHYLVNEFKHRATFNYIKLSIIQETTRLVVKTLQDWQAQEARERPNHTGPPPALMGYFELLLKHFWRIAAIHIALALIEDARSLGHLHAGNDSERLAGHAAPSVRRVQALENYLKARMSQHFEALEKVESRAQSDPDLQATLHPFV